MVKNLPAMQETRVRSLGRRDHLEKGKATHSSILAWRIPWTEESGGLQSMGSQRVGHDRATDAFISFIPISQMRMPISDDQSQFNLSPQSCALLKRWHLGVEDRDCWVLVSNLRTQHKWVCLFFFLMVFQLAVQTLRLDVVCGWPLSTVLCSLLCLRIFYDDQWQKSNELVA